MRKADVNVNSDNNHYNVNVLATDRVNRILVITGVFG